MKISKLALVSIVLLAIVTIGAVSAAEEVDSLSADDDSAVIESSIDENEAVALDVDDEVVSDGSGEKYNVTVDVSEPEEVYYGLSNSFWVNVQPADDECEEYPEGNVVVYLNDEEIATGDVDDSFEVTFNEFKEYNFRVEYLGDEHFNPGEKEFTYNLTNDMYKISTSSAVSYGSSTFDVFAPVANPSNIEITVNGKKFNVYMDEDFYEWVCDASALNYGMNTVKIYYPGDEDFAEYSGESNITVAASIQSSDNEVDWGQSVDFYLEIPKDSTGTLNVYSVEYDDDYNEVYTEIDSADVADGFANVSVTLPVGVTRIYANFTGSTYVYDFDDYIYVKPKITVPKAIETGKESYITVEASKGTKGNIEVLYSKYVLVDEDYEDYDEFELLDSGKISDGQAKFSLSGLSEGHYKINVNYIVDESGRGSYYDLYVVDKYDINLNITDFNENVIVDSDYNYVDFDIARYAEGNITVYVDGKLVKTINPEDEKYFYLDAAGLGIGEHILALNFTSEIQGVSSDSVKFNVVPGRIYIPDKMDINDRQHASANAIEVHVSDNAKGTLTILIDGEKFLTAVIDAAKADRISYVYALTDVSRGKHDVTVTYDDNKYGKISENKTVDFGYMVTIYSNDVYGQDNIIEVLLPSDLGNGDLTITLDANKLDYVINDSEIIINPSKLSIANHTVVVKYAGDDFYPAAEFNHTFEVFPEIQYPYENVLVGSDKGVSLLLPGDAKGKLNVTVKTEYVDDEGWILTKVVDEQLVSFENGNAYYSFADLPEGYYYMDVSYTGDDYLVNPISTSFDINSIDWGKYYLSLGNNQTITFIARDDDGPAQLRIILSRIVDDNKEWDDPVNVFKTVNVTIADGKASYTFTSLPVGYYKIFIAEEFSEGGVGYQGSNDFYVEHPYIESVHSDYEIGKISPVTVDMPSDANGKTIVEVYANYLKEEPDLYKTFEVPVNGPMSIDLNNVITDEGIYGIIINYTGNYGTFIRSSSPFTVVGNVKVAPNMVIDVENSVVEGSDVTVDVTIDDATGTVNINGENVTLTNGKASATIKNVAVGNLTIEVAYAGDSKFLSASKSAKVNVYPKKDAELKAVSADIDEGKVAQINITFNKDVTGRITVNGEEVTLVDGTAKYAVAGLTAGNHTFNVKFDGDKYFKSAEVTVNVKVNAVKVDPVISAKNTNVLYTANGKYTVTVYGTDGNLAKSTAVIFKIAGKQVGKATTNDKGIATYTVKNVPGTYKISATALGKTVTKTLTVKHLVTLKAVTVKKSAKKLTLQATLSKVNGKYLKNKQVTFKFNGKTYKAKTSSKGVAKVTIKSTVLKKLKVGKKVTYQATYMKDTVKKTVKVKK